MSRRSLAALVLLAVFAGGCGKSSSPTASPGGGEGTLADYEALLQQSYPSGMVLPPGLDVTSGVFVSADVGGVRAAAAIVQSGGRFVDAGVVTVHDTPRALPVPPDTLVRRSVPVNGVPYFAYSTLPALPALPTLAFDATHAHVFIASGAGAVPALRDSVLSVPRPVVSAPAADASVPRASDLAVAWSDAAADTGVYVLCAVRSLVDTTRTALVLPAHDAAGALAVPAAALGGLPAGAARLSVARYRRLWHAHGALGLNLVCEAVALVPLTLQ